MFKSVLVAVDGSANSKKALDYALELAEKFESKITLIHVYSTVVPLATSADTLSIPSLAPSASADMAVKMTEEARKRGSLILDEAEQTVKARGVSVEKVLSEGDAVKQIVALARERKSELIVVGHRGLSRLEELFLGAVSEGVSHKAPCAVLIVK